MDCPLTLYYCTSTIMHNKEAVMEPLLLALVFGLAGGLVLSLLIARNRRSTPPTFVPRRLEAPSPSLINMASIRVEGIGGLGMVAAVIAVAIADSRIRVATILAALLGGGLALGLIAWRRRAATPSSNGGPDDPVLHVTPRRDRTDSLPHKSEQAGGRSITHRTRDGRHPLELPIRIRRRCFAVVQAARRPHTTPA